jgi:peptidoglycan/LPS O-acetylase OafA/YrhL
MLLHLQVFSGPYLGQLPLLRPLIGAGWTGVELFFVLGGFVLTLGYVDRVTRPTPSVVGQFLLQRFARIWPAWAVVTVVAGAWIWSFRSAGLDPDVLGAHPDADLLTLLRQLTMTQMWGYESLGGASYVPPGWSISAEWTAYLLFPLALLLLRPLRHLPAAVLLTAAVAAMAPLAVGAFLHGTPDSEQNWVLRLACGFTSGILAALALRRLRTGWRLEAVALATVWTAVFLVLAGASWAAWAAWRLGPDGDQNFNGVVVLVFPLLVVGLSLTERGPARWLASRPMIYGESSPTASTSCTSWCSSSSCRCGGRTRGTGTSSRPASCSPCRGSSCSRCSPVPPCTTGWRSPPGCWCCAGPVADGRAHAGRVPGPSSRSPPLSRRRPRRRSSSAGRGRPSPRRAC